jgi:hypothetical protein
MGMEVYKNSSTDATLAFQSGNYRESANKYLEAFGIAGKTLTKPVADLPRVHFDSKRKSTFSASQKDFDALQLIVKDKNKLKLYRCEAAFTSGLLSWLHQDQEGAAAFYRGAIRIGDEAPEKERRKKATATITTSDGNAVAKLGDRPVGAILDEILDETRDKLFVLEHGKSVSQVGGSSLLQTQRMRPNGTPKPHAQIGTPRSLWDHYRHRCQRSKLTVCCLLAASAVIVANRLEIQRALSIYYNAVNASGRSTAPANAKRSNGRRATNIIVANQAKSSLLTTEESMASKAGPKLMELSYK